MVARAPLADVLTMAASNIGRSAVTCIIVDGDAAILDSLADVLEEAGCTVVAVAHSGIDALRQLDLHQPDAAVIDNHLADMTGIDLAREAAEVAPLTALVLHAADLPKASQAAALEAGFSGIVVKAEPSLRLPDAVETACAGEVYLDPALRDRPTST